MTNQEFRRPYGVDGWIVVENTETEPMTEEQIREEKIRAALLLLSCSRCKTYTATPVVDKSKPGVRVDWSGGFNVLHPLKDRTKKELCYYCQKQENGYFDKPDSPQRW